MSTAHPPLSPPRRWYAALIGAYLSALVSLVLALRRRKVDLVLESRDLVLLGAATNKLARLATQEKVTEPLRSPFTEQVQEADGGTSERPHGDGGRRAIGELVTCPYCLSVWITTALTGALLLAPRPTRVLLSALTAMTGNDLIQRCWARLDPN